MLLLEHLKEANISGNIKFVDLIGDGLQLTISLVHHPENQNPIVGKFIRFYLEHCRNKTYLPEKG